MQGGTSRGLCSGNMLPFCCTQLLIVLESCLPLCLIALPVIKNLPVHALLRNTREGYIRSKEGTMAHVNPVNLNMCFGAFTSIHKPRVVQSNLHL